MRRILTNRGVSNVAACIATAAATLVALELIYEVTQGPQPRRGPRVQRFVKNTWNQIQSNAASLQHLGRLGVGADAFP